MIFSHAADWAALVWFVASWSGYTVYAKKCASQERQCLTGVLYSYRLDWIRNMLRHENRITDMALLGNLTNMVSFLASTTILVIAGALTAVYSVEDVMGLLADHAFIAATTREQVQFKLLLIATIFGFAFFKFTWSMRQHTFCSILLGAAPWVKTETLTPEEEEFAMYAAKISDRAGNEFNYGLRSYYFALAVLTWLISPWLFMATCTAVVFVLYRREFRSTTLKYLILGRKPSDRTPPP